MTDKEFQQYIKEKYARNIERIEEMVERIKNIKNEDMRGRYYVENKFELFHLLEPIVDEWMLRGWALRYELSTEWIGEASQKMRQFIQNEGE